MDNMVQINIFSNGPAVNPAELEKGCIFDEGDRGFYVDLDTICDSPGCIEVFARNVQTEEIVCVVDTHLFGNGLIQLLDFVTRIRMHRPDLNIKLDVSACYLPHSRYYTPYDKACFDKLIAIINTIGFDSIKFGPVNRAALKNVAPHTQCTVSKFLDGTQWYDDDLPTFNVICHTDTTDMCIGFNDEAMMFNNDEPYQVVAACGYHNLERGNMGKKIGKMINSKRFDVADLVGKNVLIVAYDLMNIDDYVELAKDIKAGGAVYVGLYAHQANAYDANALEEMIEERGNVIDAAYCEFYMTFPEQYN